jgi:hypothetical protein
MEELTARRSSRLKEKKTSGRAITSLAQDLLAKKFGLLKDEEKMEKMTLQPYPDLYKQPLSEQSMEAIKSLTEVAVQQDKKKKKHKKEIASISEAQGNKSSMKEKKVKNKKMGLKKGDKMGVTPGGIMA